MRRLAVVVGLLAVLTVGCATAPPPAAPTDPATAVAAQAPAAVAPAPAPRGGLFSHFHKTPEQRAQKWANFANSPLGKMVNGLLTPLSALTGGILGPVGANDPAKLKLPADSPGGAAAKIAAAEAQAKAKIADLDFLATKDCRRYPEAEAALLAALRTDPNECVRWAAAKALLTGCCCTPKIVKALTVVVNQSDKDGNLAEESERVRLTAFLALEKCLRACQPPKSDEPPEKPAPKGKEEAAELAQVTYEEMTQEQVFAAARAALAKGIRVSPQGMKGMTGPANLRDLTFGPRLPVAPPLPPPTEAETPAEADTPADEQKPAVAESPSRDRSLTGLLKEALGK
jgi:hypothetical protein